MSTNSPRDTDLKLFSYHGITLPDPDPKNQGRYKVHCPELMPLIDANKGIWCKNHVHKWRYTPSDDYMYGSYYPLQPRTKVLVKFYDNDFHTGYIDRIISDQTVETTPKFGCTLNPEASTDRDDLYLIFKTPKKHNMFLILEEAQDGNNKLTENLIPNSIHFYYNYRRSTIIINEDGLHIFTMDNKGTTVEGNNSEWINKSEKIYVKENRDVYVKGDYQRHYVQGDDDNFVNGNINIYAQDQESHITKTFAVDAKKILLNCGAAKQSKKAVTNKGEDEIVKQNKIDMRISGHQKMEEKPDTYMGVSKHSVEGGVPSPGHPHLPNVQIFPGLNDRQGAVGSQQAQIGQRSTPSYPPGDAVSSRGMMPPIGGNSSGLTNIISPKDAFKNVAGGATSVISGAIGGLNNINNYVSQLSSAAQSGLSTILETPKSLLTGTPISQPLIDGLSDFNNTIRNGLIDLGNIGIDFNISNILRDPLSSIGINDYINDFTSALNSIDGTVDSVLQSNIDALKYLTDGGLLSDMTGGGLGNLYDSALNKLGVNQLYNELMNIGQTLVDGASAWINPLGLPC